jgi:hypothetical protein
MPVYSFKSNNLDYAFIFVHVPKTGGTAIENYLHAAGLSGFFDPLSYMPVRRVLRIPPTHYDYKTLDNLFRLDHFYSFAIVRHPLDRMISEYKWALKRTKITNDKGTLSFSQFMEFALERYKRDENFLAGHLKPQSRFIGGKISKVFKYENGLNSIIKQVFDDVGFSMNDPVNIPYINKSSDIPVTPTKDDVKLVRDVYAEDFEQFGYQ